MRWRRAVAQSVGRQRRHRLKVVVEQVHLTRCTLLSSSLSSMSAARTLWPVNMPQFEGQVLTIDRRADQELRARSSARREVHGGGEVLTLLMKSIGTWPLPRWTGCVQTRKPSAAMMDELALRDARACAGRGRVRRMKECVSSSIEQSRGRTSPFQARRRQQVERGQARRGRSVCVQLQGHEQKLM